MRRAGNRSICRGRTLPVLDRRSHFVERQQPAKDPGDAGDAETLEARLVARLSDGAPLLVLDNCEHVLDAAAEVVQTLLQYCPDLRVLTTQRRTKRPLGLGHGR